MMSKFPPADRPSPARLFRALASAASLAALAACASLPEKDPRTREEVLQNSLSVAAAALAAGQTDAARRLYRSLDERFNDAPEPFLGLGYIAFHERDFAAAKRNFLAAAELSSSAPATKAEALLSAGRVALDEGDTHEAREHLRDAWSTGPQTPSAPWIANALAVAAALDADYETAEARHAEALRLSSGHPRIAANFVRTLVAAGWIEDAARMHAERSPSYWEGDDGPALARLIEEARRDPASSPAASDPARPPPGAEPSVASGPSPPTTLTLTLGHSRRLHLERSATAVLVASPEVADVQLLAPDVLYVIGKGIGRTSVVVLDDGEWVDEQIVSVVLDLEPLRTSLADQPGLGQVRARHLMRGIALAGEVPSAAAADRALRLAAGALPEGVPIENELWIAAPQQVNLEVLIAEVHRTATEGLGVNWEAIQTRDGDTLGFALGRDFFSRGEAGGAQFTRGSINGESAIGIGFNRDTGNARISGMIDALATAGLANVLARPNVTAASGETASFFSGGEYPLPAGYEDGVIIFEYKKFGVLLDFVPTIADSGRIILTVRPEVSERSENLALEIVGISIPVINVRRAETTVEVGDGESIVIAGLFRNASNTVESGLPGLKDLPLLGVLFGNTQISSEELELIVVVTARLVHANPPAAPQEPVRQADGYHY